ncbi:MAG: glycosyltransferase family 4 protein [Bacteroidetes bacterium]|nr:glycosyltransferase family 4 protein [Bacteroidota bacterium]
MTVLKKRILIVCPYPLGEAPSQRFRFEQYFSVLSSLQIRIEVQSFLSSRQWKVFFKKGNSIFKLRLLLYGFFKRFGALFLAIPVDYVFIHRECTPIGPPVFEWILAKILRKKIIYDFDDAIWLTDKTHEHWLERAIRWRKKVSSICRWSHKVSAGNSYLATYAKQFNEHVIVNPTTLDTENVHRFQAVDKPDSSERVVIGWTGSHSTIKYLDEIKEVLAAIEKKFPHVEFWIIADQPPPIRLSQIHFKPWSLQTEIKDLSQFDIGLMPLPDNEWTQGKCGFKALQYMSLEIPAIASPVGVNTSLILNGVDGFLCSSTEEWVRAIEYLIENPQVRKKIGKAGRTKVESEYSVASNTQNFLSLFK